MNLRCEHITEGTFSDIAAHLFLELPRAHLFKASLP